MACEVVGPVSRTYQYRKVMKPMLERKRRARINKCLEQLKDLMVNALQTEGESITKLEKADVLELTVTYMKKLEKTNSLQIKPLNNDFEKFREGYTKCASEVSKCLAAIPGVDVSLGTNLMTHLGTTLTSYEKKGPLTILVPQTEPSPPLSSASSGYSSASDLSPALSTSSSTSSSSSYHRATPKPSSVHSIPASQGLLTIAQPLHQRPEQRSFVRQPVQRRPQVQQVQRVEHVQQQNVWRPW